VSKWRAWLDSRQIERGYVILELGDPNVDAANRAAYPTISAKAEADGTIRHGVWRTRGFSSQDAFNDVATLNPEKFVAEGEIPAYMNGQPNPQAQDWNALASVLEQFDDLTCAVATSFGPFIGPDGKPDPDLAKPLIDAGWYCLPYVYPAEHAGITLEEMAFYATHYGPKWAHAEPVLGVYGGFTVDSPAFDGKDECPGYSLWDAGEVI